VVAFARGLGFPSMSKRSPQISCYDTGRLSYTAEFGFQTGVRPGRNVRWNTGECGDNLYGDYSNLQPLHLKLLPHPLPLHSIMDNLPLHRADSDGGSRGSHSNRLGPQEAPTGCPRSRHGSWKFWLISWIFKGIVQFLYMRGYTGLPVDQHGKGNCIRRR
jgi:hypothetical protein